MVTPTTGPGSASEIARQAILGGTKLIVAAGGDGTLNEVAGGMVASSVPLAILPAGTANVLATELVLGRDLERAAALIPTCVAQRISVGRLHGATGARHFLAMAGVGFDAQIVHDVSAGLKTRLGKGAYWIGGFAQAVRLFPEFEIQIDGSIRAECSFALVTRVRNYGGDFEIARDTSLFDDRFEVVLFRGRYSLPYLKYFYGMIAGRLSGMRGVTFLRARKLRVSDASNRRVHTQVDGEYAGPLPASIELVPDALTLLIPPAYLQLHSGRSAVPAGARAIE